MRRGRAGRLSWKLRMGGLGIALAVSACQSARVSDREIDTLFRGGKYEEAAARLEAGYRKHGEEGGKDSLLYLLDLGLARHQAGQFEEANRAFLKADEVAEIKDYTKLSVEAAVLITSDLLKAYKGEEFENVMISTYLAMNYALLGKSEDARVEARRVNRKLERMVTEGKRKYQQNAFARYLSGILYEADGNWNSAYIDYKKTWELNPEAPGLGKALWRVARRGGFREDLPRWEAEFGEGVRSTAPPRAEIIVFYQNGISPRKLPNPDFSSLPRFYARKNPAVAAEVELVGKAGDQAQNQAKTQVLYDIEQVAIQNLEEKYGSLVAKKLAGLIVKETLADQIERRTKSPLAGFLARVAMYASDQADCRSWALLPKDLQMARLEVPPGVHEVRLTPVGPLGERLEPLPGKVVSVAAGQKVFVNFRYLP